MDEGEERMGNRAKLKLKSAGHKTEVGWREGKITSLLLPPYKTMETWRMLNDKLRNTKFWGAAKFIKGLACFGGEAEKGDREAQSPFGLFVFP